MTPSRGPSAATRPAEELDAEGEAGLEASAAEDDAGPLPWVPMAALGGSGAFAAWMSLTCFVC